MRQKEIISVKLSWKFTKEGTGLQPTDKINEIRCLKIIAKFP